MEKEPKNAAPDAAVPQPTACVETEPNANAAPDAAVPEPTACVETEPKNAAPDAAVPEPTACVEMKPNNANAAPDAAVPLEHQSRWHEIVPGIHSASVLQVGKFSIITSYS